MADYPNFAGEAQFKDTASVPTPPANNLAVYSDGGVLKTKNSSGTVTTLGASVDLASPPAIGNTTPNTGAFTTLSVSEAVSNTITLNWHYRIGGSSALSGIGSQYGLIKFFNSNSETIAFGPSEVYFSKNFSQNSFQWIGWASDTKLFRDNAADIIGQRNGTTAQTFRLYNTYTDASNYERGFMSWTSNVLEIGSECAGTGSTRTTRLVAQDKSGSFFPVVEIAFRPNGALARRLSFTNNSGAFIQFGIDGSYYGNFSTDGLCLGTAQLGFASGPAQVIDVSLRRDAAGVLAQYNGTNAQTFRLYNTFTSSTNFERLNLRWASNEFILDAEKGSVGGTLRGVKIGSATTSLLGFYGVTPVDQPATVTDPTGGLTVDAEARTDINAIIDRLQELGLVA